MLKIEKSENSYIFRLDKNKPIKFILTPMLTWQQNAKKLKDNIEQSKNHPLKEFLGNILDNQFFFTSLMQMRDSMKLLLDQTTKLDKDCLVMRVFDIQPNYFVRLANYYFAK